MGITVGQSLLTARLPRNLTGVLPPDKLAGLLRSTTALAKFTPEELAVTAHTYGEVFNLQNRVMLGFGAAGLLACLGAWKRKPVEFNEMETKRRRMEGEIADDGPHNANRGGGDGGKGSAAAANQPLSLDQSSG